jgi:aspartokinase-like uncharacterized kinase
MRPVSHGREGAKGQAEPECNVFVEIDARRLTGPQRTEVDSGHPQLLQDPVLDQRQIAAGEPAHVVRLFQLRCRRRRQLPDLEEEITGATL